MGVLCVQHADPHKYDDVEIEALQTVAMVLSELIANADLADASGSAAARPQSTAAIRIQGLKLVDGMASGYAVFHQPRVTIKSIRLSPLMSPAPMPCEYLLVPGAPLPEIRQIFQG